MLKTRTKKIYRDIRARKGRSVLVILSIMIGVFGVATMMSITDLLNRQLEKDIRSDFISHTRVYVVSSADTISAEENERYLDHIRQLPGVVDVEGQAIYPVSWQKNGQVEDGYLFTFTEPFGEGNREAVSRLLEGRYPEPGEIAIEKRLADKHGLELGDVVQLQDEPFTIVGVVVHSYFSFMTNSDASLPVTHRLFANYEDAQRVLGFSGLSAIHVRYENMDMATDGLDSLMETLSLETPYVPVYSINDDPDNNFLASVLDQMTGASDALGILAMVVSGFLVTNVMNTIVMEQRAQIGTMKSLGATFSDNFWMFGGMALVYGVIGTTLGLLLAAPVAASAARPIADWASAYIDGLRLSPVGLGTGAVMGILVPIFAALIPVWLSARLSIFKALTDRGISSSWGRSRLSRWVGKIPLPTAASQAVNNIWQKKGRLTFTGLTLTAAVGAFMGSTAMAGSLDDFITDAFDVYGYDIRINPQRVQDFEELLALILKNSDTVEAVYPGFNVSVGVEGFKSDMSFSEGSNQVAVYGIDPTTPTWHFDLVEGDGWRDDTSRAGVVISRTVSELMNKHPGDQLTMFVGGVPYTYTIIGVDAFGFDAIYMDWREIATIAGFVDENGEPIAGTYYVDMYGKPGIEAVADEIDSLTVALEAHGIQAGYTNQPEAAESLSEQAGVLGIMLQLMSMVMAAVGAIGLMAALSMAVFERQKEIGVMRSVGAPSRAIMGQFMVEGLIIGLLAWLVALPLSVVLGQNLMSVLPFDTIEFRYPPQLSLLGLAGVLGVAAIASLWPSFVASRKTVADILRYQ